ncbi:MAG: carbohydrate ABC transporter permease [Aeromicrobium sp.]
MEAQMGRVIGAVAPETRRSTTSRRPSWAAIGFVAPIVIYLAIFYAYPLAQNVSLSLHRYDRGTFVHGGAPFVGLDIYGEVIRQPRFWRVVRQTATFTLVSITFQYAIGLALAVFFQRNFRLSNTLRALFLVPWLLPVIVSGTTWQWMMNPDNGAMNKLVGWFGVDPVWWLSADKSLMSVTIANIWLGIPFNLVILYSGLQNIPTSLYEAAAMDGAGPWRQFRHISFPLLRPVSMITLLLGFIYTLKVVDIIWIMTTGTGKSQTIATWSYGLAFGKGTSGVIRYSEASALGSILLVVALTFGLIYVAIQNRWQE